MVFGGSRCLRSRAGGLGALWTIAGVSGKGRNNMGRSDSLLPWILLGRLQRLPCLLFSSLSSSLALPLSSRRLLERGRARELLRELKRRQGSRWSRPRRIQGRRESLLPILFLPFPDTPAIVQRAPKPPALLLRHLLPPNTIP